MFYPGKHKHVAHDEMILLAKKGHQIKVISVWGGEKILNKSLPFKIIYLKQKIFWISLLKLLIKHKKRAISHLKDSFKYLGKIDSLRFVSQYEKMGIENFDRIHAHFASNNALKAYLASRFYNIPFSCTGHGSELVLHPLPQLKELILHSKPFITISNFNKKFLLKKYHIPEYKIVVNYCGVDTNYFTPPKNRINSNFNITSVTAMKKIKGVEYLIEACKLLDKERIDFKCIIIGGGNLFDKIRDLITINNLDIKIKLLGPVDQREIKKRLSEASIFVLPSLSEGIPIALMEAMAMELPVIATNITGIPELVSNNVDGILVEPRNPFELAEKIKYLYYNPDVREKLGKNARKKVCEKFNLYKNTEKFEKLLYKYS